MITTTIKLHSRPEKRKEVTQTVKEIAHQIDKNTKCREVITYWNIDDENTFFLVENWSTEQDLHEHRSSRLFSVLLGVVPLLEYPMEIEMVSEVEKSLLTRISHQKVFHTSMCKLPCCSESSLGVCNSAAA